MDLENRRHTGLVVSPRLARNQNLDGMVHRLLEAACVLGSLVREDSLPSMNLVQGDGVLLNDFDRHRLGGGKVPDLLAFGLCLLKGAGNGSSVEVFLGFAQVEALGNDLAWTLAGGLLAELKRFTSRAG